MSTARKTPIPVEFLLPDLAVKPTRAAKLLAMSRTTLWRKTARGEIRKLDYGAYAVRELERYVREAAI